MRKHLGKTNRWHFLILEIIFLLVIVSISGCGLEQLPKPQVPQTTVLLDSEGREIDSLYKENRIVVSGAKIPDTLRKAVVSIEDERFYSHFGIDPIGIVRALYKDILAGKIVEGGSTLTQQLAKNLYLTQKKTLARKAKEAFLTLQLERTYTKDEILDMYLNQIYFGQGAYGVEVASRRYFDKGVSELKLWESAMLAALPRAPSYYDPYKRPNVVKKRRDLVLSKMAKLGDISEEDMILAQKQPLELAPMNKPQQAPYFIKEVIQILKEKFPEEFIYQGGLKIYTSLDLEMQHAAEKAMEEVLGGQDPELEAALVAMDVETGYIKALVGGRDYRKSQFNRAINPRQPGSAMKPFLYAAAIAKGYTEASLIKCEPVEYQLPGEETYKPGDYGDTPYHYRNFTLKEALKISDNVVAVRLNSILGPESMAETANSMGIDTNLPPYLSLPLGTIEVSPLEIATAYSTLANQGLRIKPIYITKVVDRNGQVLLENNPEQEIVMDKSTAYILTDMMESVLKPGGTGSNLRQYLNRPAAGKTGTTNEFREAWFAGFTPEISAAVYVGFDDRRPVWLPGGSIAGPIWAQFLAEALKDTAKTEFTEPDNMVEVSICLDTGLRATANCPRVMEMSFIEGTEPTEWDTSHNPELNWKEENENSGKQIEPHVPWDNFLDRFMNF